MSDPPPADPAAGAVPATALAGPFPKLALPLAPPLPPMEARSSERLPRGAEWSYEPKWDGFRCLAFRDGATVALQSKAGQPLARYFPEVVARLAALPARRFVLDGELVVARDGRLTFDDLLQRIHPATTRVARLATETPATFVLFDLLVDAAGERHDVEPLAARRAALDAFLADQGKVAALARSARTADPAVADRWMASFGPAGLDGVVAKRVDVPYASGRRDAMVKVKQLRTADCVVGGFRWAARQAEEVGSLLLGLYDANGLLHHVGFAASFARRERAGLRGILEPFRDGAGFTGRAPGGPSRWSTDRSTEWEPLRPELVVEVRYDHAANDRFRHGTKLLRWRPEKRPQDCTVDQIRPAGGADLTALGLGP